VRVSSSSSPIVIACLGFQLPPLQLLLPHLLLFDTQCTVTHTTHNNTQRHTFSLRKTTESSYTLWHTVTGRRHHDTCTQLLQRHVRSSTYAAARTQWAPRTSGGGSAVPRRGPARQQHASCRRDDHCSAVWIKCRGSQHTTRGTQHTALPQHTDARLCVFVAVSLCALAVCPPRCACDDAVSPWQSGSAAPSGT